MSTIGKTQYDLANTTDPTQREQLQAGINKLTTPTKTVPTGTLNEGSVLQNIRELTNYDPKESSKWYKRYRELYKETKSREDAFEQTQAEMTSGSEGESGGYGYLWGE